MSRPISRSTAVQRWSRHRSAIPPLAFVALLVFTGCGETLENQLYAPAFGGATGPCGEECDRFYLPPFPPDELHVVSYNVFLRPPPVNAIDESACRANRIGRWLAEAGADIVALQETFQPTAVTSLTGHASSSLPHQVVSQPPPARLLGTSGGLSILSRWPIESIRTITYDSCKGAMSDCAAAKGAVHAVIRVSEDSRVNVVATHLDAGGSPENRQARAAQIHQLRDFMDEVDPSVGPTLALGDFNVDALGVNGEYYELTSTLDVRDIEPETKPTTVNCETNVLCNSPVLPRRLDYIFTPNREDRLSHVHTRHLPMADSSCGRARFLSDHRAVWTVYETDLVE